MANWNPNATATLGLEWMPNAQGSYTLDAINKMTAVSLDQTASIGIGSILVPNVGIPIRGGIYAIEVYDNETAVSDAPVTLTAVPNEDVTDGTWLNQASSNTNLFASIDDGTTLNTADWVRVTGTASRMDQRFNTGSLSLTGKRILAVRMRVYATMGATALFIYGLNLSGTDYSGGIGIAGPQSARWFSTTWLYNPSTKKPWTIADVQALDTTDEFWMQGQTQAGVWSAIDVFNVVLEVVVQTETRIAVGTLDDTPISLNVGTVAAPIWNTATVTTPTGGAWTKDGTGRHLYTVRRISSAGAMAIPYLEGITAPSIGRSFIPTVDPTYGYATAMGSALPRMYPYIQRTTVPADHPDSQPYHTLKTASIRTGQNAESEFSNAAASPYGILRFLVNNQLGVTADLDVKVKRRSDNVQFGTTATYTRAQYASGVDLGGGWKLVQMQMGTAGTLAAATQYYVEFSSSTVAGAPWTVVVLNVGSTGQLAGYNSTTDAATFNGAAEDVASDIVVTLGTIPTAPTTFTAGLGSQAVAETVACVNTLPRADLAWSATALGGSFLRYEIERSEDGGTTWVPIAYVTAESVVAWKDYEALRGIAVSYRIRVVRQDGAFSAWATSSPVVKPLTSSGYMTTGSMSSTATTPDSPRVSVTGDIDLRLRVSMDTWAVGTLREAQVLASKIASGAQASWYWYFDTNAVVHFSFTKTGSTLAMNDSNSTVGLPNFGDGAAAWLRVTREAVSGVVTFYYASDSPTEPTVWTQLGAPIANVTGNMFDGTDPVDVGGYFTGSAPVNGKILRFVMYDGLGPDPYMKPDPTGGTSFVQSMALPASAYPYNDVEVITRVHAADWTANIGFGSQNSGAGTNGWAFYSQNRTVVFRCWLPADTAVSSSTTLPTGIFANNAGGWIRAVRAAGTGVVTFFYAADQSNVPTTWTQLGTPVTSTSGSLVPAGLFRVGGGDSIGLTFEGRIFRLILKDGAFTSAHTVLDFDPRLVGRNMTGAAAVLYGPDQYGTTYQFVNNGAVVRGFPAANPDFTQPSPLRPNALPDSAGNIWTLNGLAPSQWVETGQSNATMFFVSNYNPAQNQAYEYRPAKAYDFPSADEQQRAGAFMRDYHLAANPLENRGVIAHWTLLVGVDDKLPPGGGSWRAWDPLRALSVAVIPYVCALDARGSRLYCQLRVPNGDEDSSGGADLYLAEVEAAQVVATPFVVQVTS